MRNLIKKRLFVLKGKARQKVNITKTIEDIIREDIPEAEIIDTPENKPKNDNDNVNN